MHKKTDSVWGYRTSESMASAVNSEAFRGGGKASSLNYRDGIIEYIKNPQL